MPRIAFVSLLSLLLLPVAAALGAPPTANDFFEKEVRPLLVEHCIKCHGDKKPKGGLRLTSRAHVLAGGDSGPAAVPGKPKDSLLIQALAYVDTPRMPPKKKLSDRDVATLTRWVQIGMPWPETGAKAPAPATGPWRITDEQRRFWAYQPVRAHAPPAVKNSRWPRTSLDHFVLAGLEARGLRPAKQADRRTLIRRATFDLTGLPPTPSEVEAFVADRSPDAFARVVDRLLASSAYGERYGRHWLDLVRYTDSFDARGIGGEMDCADAWRYRDWVVQALNRDLPYDRFLADQIAGDLFPGPDGGLNRDGIIATGMLALGNWGGGDADKDKLLTDIADDQVDVVTRTFLGLTVACARCHDHKFDPISTADYYGLAGIFFSTHILPNVGPKTNGPPMMRIPLLSPLDLAKRRPHEQRLANLTKELQAARKAAELASSFAATDSRSPFGIDGRAEVRPLVVATLLALARREAEREAVRRALLPAPDFANGAQDGGVPGSPHAGTHDVHIHHRGRYDRLGPVVPRRFPEVLAGTKQAPIAKGSGRRELAHWLTSPENPLPARVMANRLWQWHFGEGIVRTPSNFGWLGERPTHPELLDHLAGELVRSGWSIKRMHRLILLSATYQQSSEAEPEVREADPENRQFGRMNRRRLEAEAVRDALLAASGRLDRTMKGPATRSFAAPRRTLYLMTIRSDRSGFGPLFDSADNTAPVDRRTVSTVAPQALFLLNNPFAIEQACALARRVVASAETDTGRVKGAYAVLFGRPPELEELAIGLELLQASRGPRPAEKAWEEYCQVLLCANEFLYVD